MVLERGLGLGLEAISNVPHPATLVRASTFDAPCIDTQHSRDKGWRSLYAGLKPSVVATATSQGIYFYVYSLLRGWAVVRLGDEGDRVRGLGCCWISVLGGGVAEVSKL